MIVDVQANANGSCRLAQAISRMILRLPEEQQQSRRFRCVDRLLPSQNYTSRTVHWTEYSLLGASGGELPRPFFSWLCTEGSGQTPATTRYLKLVKARREALALRFQSRNTEDTTDETKHPTAGRKRRYKNPAAVPVMHDLPLPSLPDHLRTDEDGPSCSDDEREQSD